MVYADDFIAGFEYEAEAIRYYQALKERLSKYGLEIEAAQMAELQEPEKKLHMEEIPYDADLLPNGKTKEICKSLR